LFKIFLTSVVLFSALPASERSMFGAGDLESENPYGLTAAEKVIIKNKQILSTNAKQIKKVDSRLLDLEQRLEGVESLLDGDSQKLNKVYIDLKKQKVKFESKSELENEYKNKVAIKLNKLDLKLNQLNSDIINNQENIQRLKVSFEKIVNLVNSINKDYVSKDDFKKLLSMLDKKEKRKSVKQVKIKKNKSSFSTRTKKQLINEARELFKKDYFTKALPILDYLIEKRYRPAECNYMKGEIKFYRKKYKQALGYFKTSITLYDQAKYLPKMLLHSAISFEKTGDKDSADKFYSTLVEVYPGTDEAKEASKKIN